MEYRIPRKNINKEGIDKNFPKVCIVCGEKSDRGCYADIHYHPKVKVSKEIDNFILKAPLCETHYKNHQKGKKQAKYSMYLLFSSIIPFVLGLVFLEALNNNTAAIIMFILAAITTGSGFFLFNPSNELLKESREKIKIKLITGHEVILDIKDEKLAVLLERAS